jgi:hypothetical protein
LCLEGFATLENYVLASFLPHSTRVLLFIPEFFISLGFNFLWKLGQYF